MVQSVHQESRHLHAPGARRVVFNVAGTPDGDLVFFHTGTPAAPVLHTGLIRECLERGLRLACIARPGYAGSDRLPGRSYADAPADSALIADALGAEQFYSIGHSGGGGPALADAALLSDRVRAVVSIATLAPRLAMGPGWRDGVDPANGKELAALEAGEPTLRGYIEELAAGMGRVERAEQITEDPEFERFYAPADLACFQEEEFAAFAVQSIRGSVGHGVDGWVDDDFAFFGDWGFDLDRIIAPVRIWHGGEDRIIPLAHSEWLAANVPGGQFRLRAEEGHISVLTRHFGEMLDELIALG